MGVADTLSFSTRGCCCQSGRGRQKGDPALPHRIQMPRGNFYLGQFFKVRGMGNEKFK